MTKITDAYSHLFHYTTGGGLQGIVESQQLWATHVRYLNDNEEYVGYFRHRLPLSVEAAANAALGEIVAQPSGPDWVAAQGGQDSVLREMRKMSEVIEATMLERCAPFLISFCGAADEEVAANGLLSQWRGYGRDGGYALVFETDGLHELLTEESESFAYLLSPWCDAEYYDEAGNSQARHPETDEYERRLRDVIKATMLSGDEASISELLEPLINLSCSYKHRGFREEREVRIAITPLDEVLHKLERDAGKAKPKKPINFRLSGSTLIPYIKLFGNGGKRKLPITKVIVGPHPDRDKRKGSVELLLGANGIQAPVSVSNIPFGGF